MSINVVKQPYGAIAYLMAYSLSTSFLGITGTFSRVISWDIFINGSHALLFVFSHGLANIFRKFGPTYAVAMAVYFGIMIICGMMGVQTESMPKALQYVASLLPMSYVGSDFINFWQEGSYNFGPLIQAFLFFGAMCGILLLCASYKNRRRIK